MKGVKGRSFRLGMAVFLMALMPTNAFAATSGTTVENSGSFEVTIESSGDGVVMSEVSNARVEDTGPDSTNKIEYKIEETTKVTNDNEVNVEVKNEQVAKTGDAVVSNNTTGGSAVTGDATNVSTTDVCVSINNSLKMDGDDDACKEKEPEPVTPPAAPEPGRGGGVLGAVTTRPVGGAGGQVLAAALPAELPVTGSPVDAVGLVIALLASALTYTVLLRRQKLLQATASTR